MAQSTCTDTVCRLAEEVKDKVTAECPKGEGVGRGGVRMGLIWMLSALPGPEAEQPYPRVVRDGSRVLPVGCCLSARVLKAKRWISAGHWHQWPDTDEQFWAALSAAVEGGAG